MVSNSSSAASYSCDGLPEKPATDLELIAFYRGRVGNDIVNEQISTFGADAVMLSMQRAHRAHLTAAALDETQLHQRAELLESLMLELEIPAVGESPDTATDAARVQLFTQTVKAALDKAIEYEMQLQMQLVDHESNISTETISADELDAPESSPET